MRFELSRTSATTEIPCRVTVNVSPEALGIKVESIAEKDGKQYTPERDHRIALSEFHQAKSWGDCGSMRVLLFNDGTYAIISREAATFNTKAAVAQAYADCRPFSVTVDTVFADADFTEMGIGVFIPENWEFESDTEYTLRDIHAPSLYKLPALTLEGPDVVRADGRVVLTLSCLLGYALAEKPLTLYLTHDNGYLPKRELTVTGRGEFPVMALGLTEGDVIGVKAGFKYWTNVVSKTLRVTA